MASPVEGSLADVQGMDIMRIRVREHPRGDKIFMTKTVFAEQIVLVLSSESDTCSTRYTDSRKSDKEENF
jgi:hypothetical protein